LAKQYTIYIRPAVMDEIRDLPGNMRQRVRATIGDLANTARPAQSKALSLSEVTIEVRRIRIERWRIIYTVDNDDAIIDIMAIRKRPPYDYGDLAELLADS
jgi:mRNA-degrading endonuclease RelE of RelBE toxin-antitoxin system